MYRNGSLWTELFLTSLKSVVLHYHWEVLTKVCYRLFMKTLKNHNQLLEKNGHPMSPLRAHCWPVCQTSSPPHEPHVHRSDKLFTCIRFIYNWVCGKWGKGSTCFVFTLELHFCQKCHHKERSIAAIWKPKLCCLTTVCAFFHAFAAPHVTWGRPCFPSYAYFYRKRAFNEILCSDILFWFLTEVVKATDLWHKQL